MIGRNQSMIENIFEKRVAGIEPFSMLDFGENLCGILFYNGCTFKCPYCYNKSLAQGAAKTLPAEEVITFLNERRGKLDGIVFSGGECTAWGHRLINDIYYARQLGYKIKVDTNGTSPYIIRHLIENKLVDYVALDYKAPKEKWNFFMGAERVFNLFLETLDILQNSDIPFEVRTTIHTDIVNESDILSILRHLESIGYKGTYFIQFFFPAETTLGNVSKEMRHFDTEQIKSDTIKIEYRNKEGNPPA